MELFLDICGVQSICFRIPDERISDMSGLLIEPRVMVERHWIACNVFPPNALIIFATVDPSKTERFIFPEWSHENGGKWGDISKALFAYIYRLNNKNHYQ